MYLYKLSTIWTKWVINIGLKLCFINVHNLIWENFFPMYYSTSPSKPTKVDDKIPIRKKYVHIEKKNTN